MKTKNTSNEILLNQTKEFINNQSEKILQNLNSSMYLLDQECFKEIEIEKISRENNRAKTLFESMLESLSYIEEIQKKLMTCINNQENFQKFKNICEYIEVELGLGFQINFMDAHLSSSPQTSPLHPYKTICQQKIEDILIPIAKVYKIMPPIKKKSAYRYTHAAFMMDDLPEPIVLYDRGGNGVEKHLGLRYGQNGREDLFTPEEVQTFNQLRDLQKKTTIKNRKDKKIL